MGDERVNAIEVRFFNRRVGPVRVIVGPVFDPANEQFLLVLAERLVGTGSRHDLVWIVAENTQDQLAVLWVAGHDRVGVDGILTDVETKVAFAVFLVGTVAIVASIRKNGADIAIEVDVVGSETGEDWGGEDS